MVEPFPFMRDKKTWIEFHARQGKSTLKRPGQIGRRNLGLL